jgi:hypothetical protein
MIVFAIVFGEPYVKSYFDVALPSLLTDRNVPAMVRRGIEVSLVFFTTESSVPLIAERAKTPVPGMELFSSVDVSYLKDKNPANYADRGQWLNDTMRDLMLKVVAHCLKHDQPFIFTAADVFYSNGIIENCYLLHRATAKVVGTFNGRVEPGEDLEDFHRLRQSGDSGYRKAFLKYRTSLWRTWTINSSEAFPDANFGHVILEDGEFVHLFCPNLNPFMGRFTTDDLVFFTDSTQYVDWDSHWRIYLADHNRLVILTNLDAGMSIEIDPPASDPKMISNLRFFEQRRVRRAETLKLMREWEMDTDAFHAAQRKAHYDTEFNMFCFTVPRDD